MNELSERLMDAYLLDDFEEVERIKQEIESRRKKIQTKPITVTKINTVLNDEKTSAIRMYEFLNKTLGENWWEWEVETIERVLWLKYGAALEDINRDKLLAIRHTCRSDGCFSDWYEFNQIALAFAGCIADFEYIRNPSPGMIINTVQTINHIRPDRGAYFSNDVIGYMCIVLMNEGVYTPPPSLVFVIKDRMKTMVSPSTSKNWLSILKRYNKFVNRNYTEVGEDLIDTQAKRLLRAEMAASVYNS